MACNVWITFYIVNVKEICSCILDLSRIDLKNVSKPVPVQNLGHNNCYINKTRFGRYTPCCRVWKRGPSFVLEILQFIYSNNKYQIADTYYTFSIFPRVFLSHFWPLF